MLPNRSPAIRAAIILLVIASTATLYRSLGYSFHDFKLGKIAFPGSRPDKQASELALDIAQSPYLAPPEATEECETLFGLQFLKKAAASIAPYCENESSRSHLTCSFSPIQSDKPGTTCTLSGAIWDPTQGVFYVDCHQQDPPDRLPIYKFPVHWYETGAGYLMGKYVKIESDASRLCGTERARPIVLIKREGIYNPWHVLMEIMSFTFTIDVLAMQSATQDIAPAVNMTDFDVLILDDMAPGPFFELWQLFTSRPPLQLSDLKNEASFCGDVIVPFAGADNPIWKADWENNGCTESSILSVFATRILNMYSLPLLAEQDRPLTVTFIDRKGTRKLSNQTSLLNAARAAIPKATIQDVDFAALTLHEQLTVVRQTDVLIGVHGAGLTHAMFLPRQSAVVEIQPGDLDHRGFRNLAHLRGHRYFRMHGKPSPGGDWQSQDSVQVDQAQFLHVITTAVQSMYHRGVLDIDND